MYTPNNVAFDRGAVTDCVTAVRKLLEWQGVTIDPQKGSDAAAIIRGRRIAVGLVRELADASSERMLAGDGLFLAACAESLGLPHAAPREDGNFTAAELMSAVNASLNRTRESPSHHRGNALLTAIELHVPDALHPSAVMKIAEAAFVAHGITHTVTRYGSRAQVWYDNGVPMRAPTPFPLQGRSSIRPSEAWADPYQDIRPEHFGARISSNN